MGKFKDERMLVFGIFPIPLSHAPQKFYIFQYFLLPSVTATKIYFVCCTESLRQTYFLFVVLSHGNKQIFFICCPESLWQTKFVYVAKNMPKIDKKYCTFCTLFLHFYCLFGIRCVFFGIFGLFWHFVCRSDSVPQTKKSICRSDSARQTNEKLCHSDLVQQTILKKYPISLWHVSHMMWQRNCKYI